MPDEFYESLTNEADKRLYRITENIIGEAETRPDLTNEQSLREEVGDISEEMLDMLFKGMIFLWACFTSEYAKDVDAENAMACGIFDIFREGVRIGRRLGFEEAERMPRL